MRICILGGCGFIGSWCAEYYAKQDKDNQIYIVDSLYKDVYINKGKSKYFIKRYLEKYENIIFIHRDIRNQERMEALFKIIQPEVIIHAAGQVATTTSVIKPYLDFDINVRGTISILETIRKLNIDPILVFCSTNKIYGDRVNQKEIIEKETRYEYKDCDGINENDLIDHTIHSPYGTSKLCADLYVQEYGYTYGLKIGVFRMSCIFGPRQMGYQEQGWLVHFILSTLKNIPLKIYGDGKQVRDLLYISDLVNAYDLFITKYNQLGNKVYNMGGGRNNILSLLECIKILEKYLNKTIQFDFYDWRLADQKVYISDISKVSKELNWKPIISPEKGIKKVVDFFLNF